VGGDPGFGAALEAGHVLGRGPAQGRGAAQHAGCQRAGAGVPPVQDYLGGHAAGSVGHAGAPFAGEELRYSHGNEEVFSHGNNGKILPDNLSEIIREAGNPDELNNLYFSINQDSPARRVDIQIGSGDWTTYLIESDDQTWAYGRYHQLTEMLLANRSLYAKGHSAAPEVPQKGKGDKWRAAVWELSTSWRATLASAAFGLLVFLLIIAITPIPIALVYYYNAANTALGRTDKINAQHVLQWYNNNGATLFFIFVTYIVMLVLLRRRLKSLLRSRIALQETSFFSQLSFRRNRDDAVQILSLYLTLLLVIVGVIALIIQISSS
jgi:hypothetical protein